MRWKAIVAFALALATAVVATDGTAQSGGRTGGASLPMTKAIDGSLTYGSFTGFNCSQASFFTNAVATLTIAGQVFVDGTTFLDGVPFDTYHEDLQFGPDSFPTHFDRVFTPPPPGSSTYTFEFRSTVSTADGHVAGTSTTTISCANGVLSATSEYVSIGGRAVPAGHPLGWALLALLLASAASLRLNRRRA